MRFLADESCDFAVVRALRQQIGQTVNAGLTMLYWHIGRRIRQDILKEDRAEYGGKLSYH
jgi:hypothetical protein